MGKGLGSLGSGFGLQSITKGIGLNKAKGLYPSKGKGLGLYGTAQFPTILESYNRTSDYKRWQLGQAYYFGTGRTWDDLSIYSNSRFSTPAVSGVSKDIVTMFPSEKSPERVWYVGQRTRGSIAIPFTITTGRQFLLTGDPDPANHLLRYDITSLPFSYRQIFNIFIGDQFEDSGTVGAYPDNVRPKPVGSLALTLVDVNASTGHLFFDLSRAYTRVELNGNIYWKKKEYDPSNPHTFQNGRYLISSTKFFCCCPDHLGGALANLEFPKGDIDQDMFPMPNASRTVRAAWESQGAGYYRQWRSLNFRVDMRRECKHIHAMRWECGIPWYEPNDIPTQYFGDNISGMLTDTSFEKGFSDTVYDEYNERHRINYDRYALSLAEVVGLELFPGTDVRDSIRPDARPMLWNDHEEPDPLWCRRNDWWCKRGTQEIKIFNSTTQKFESTVTLGGVEYPMIEVVEGGSSTAPVIVP